MKELKYILAMLSILIAIPACTFGQQVQLEQKYESRQGRWYLIPEVDLWFGNYTIAEVSPQIAYHITDRWSVGAGFNYNFYKEIETYYTAGYSTHLYGGRAFSRFAILTNAEEWLPVYLFSDLFIHLEYQCK